MDVVWIIFLFAVGACLGSFLNVVIYRLPRGESIAFPGSHCPSCGKAIRWYDNVPLASWLLLRARCRFCKAAISPRYILIELLAGVLVAGLYVCLFVFPMRSDIQSFARDWPLFVAYAALLLGLLAAAAVDIELFIVPLPVMWFCAALGVAAASFRPTAVVQLQSPVAAATAVAALVGLAVAELLLRWGVLPQSFIDASETPVRPEVPDGKKKSHKPDKPSKTVSPSTRRQDGVEPRLEVLKELLYLLPVIVLGGAAYLLATRVPAVHNALTTLMGNPHTGAPPAWPEVGSRILSGAGAVVGLLVGAGMIWATRILGTLGFGREAMGMGDVHILAAIGAVAGWPAAVLTFFAAPLFGLVWALYLLAARGKRELPYGPWLALAALVVILCQDAILGLLRPG